MFIGTHALLPACVALTTDSLRLATRRRELFPEWSIPVIALFGTLPDICTPHITLDARFSSWSHTLAFLVGLLPICLLVAVKFPKESRILLFFSFWFAVAIHLATDTVAGGIPWLMPWVMPSGNHIDRTGILGDFYIHPSYWLAFDAFFVILTWILVGLRGALRKRI
ncbi:MAG: metal-dependent hydrolase [Verrucomicrobiota bacterium]